MHLCCQLIKLPINESYGPELLTIAGFAVLENFKTCMETNPRNVKLRILQVLKLLLAHLRGNISKNDKFA